MSEPSTSARSMILRGFVHYDLPISLIKSVAAYMIHGTLPDRFLLALLEGNYRAAAAHADLDNQRCFHAWFGFLDNCLPDDAHGSPEKVVAWMERRGLGG